LGSISIFKKKKYINKERNEYILKGIIMQDIKLFKYYLASQQKIKLNEEREVTANKLSEEKEVTIIFLPHGEYSNYIGAGSKPKIMSQGMSITVTSKKDLAKQLRVPEVSLFAPWKNPRKSFKNNPMRSVADDFEGIFNKALSSGGTLYAFADRAAMVKSNSLALYGDEFPNVRRNKHPGGFALGLHPSKQKASEMMRLSHNALQKDYD
jgi:hypothetical protein